MSDQDFDTHYLRTETSEINMVPMIDVMLVLLIVFMITVPMVTHSVSVALPQATSQPTPKDQQKKISLAINDAGEFFWNNEQVDQKNLELRLRELGTVQENQGELHLRADKDTKYEVITKVMSMAKLAGVKKMGFITKPEQNN